MLTKNQYKFLRCFIRTAKKSKQNDKILKYYDREKVKIEEFTELLSKHSELYPAMPFDNKERKGDMPLKGFLLISYIKGYLDNIGISDCFDYDPPISYGLSQKGIQKIDEYKREFSSRIKIPKLSILISIFALLTAIVSLVIGICK